MVELSGVWHWLGDQQLFVGMLISTLLLVVIWRFDFVLSRYTRISEKTVADLREFRRVATVTVLVGALAWLRSLPLPPWLAGPFEAVGGPRITGGIVEFLPPFLVANEIAVLVTALGFWWAWKLRAQGDEILERVVAREYDETLAPIAENVWDVTIVAAFVLLVLDQWGIAIAALIAPAGILGIILGFAARETVANFFGSISLYADETYKRGDYIELENGLSGTVRDISVRSTVLQTLDGNLVTIPNSTLNESKITNKSTPRPDRRIRTRVGVAYDTDPEEVKEILTEAARPVSEHREPMVHLREFGDSALVFEVFVWIDSPDEKFTAEDELNMAIYRALDEAGIEIPYPQREVAVERDLTAG